MIEYQFECECDLVVQARKVLKEWSHPCEFDPGSVHGQSPTLWCQLNRVNSEGSDIGQK